MSKCLDAKARPTVIGRTGERLRVRRDVDGEDGEVGDSDVGSAVDLEMRVDYARLILQRHGRGSDGVVSGGRRVSSGDGKDVQRFGQSCISSDGLKA